MMISIVIYHSKRGNRNMALLIMICSDMCDIKYLQLTLKAPGGGIFTCAVTFFVLVVPSGVLGDNDPIVNKVWDISFHLSH